MTKVTLTVADSISIVINLLPTASNLKSKRYISIKETTQNTEIKYQIKVISKLF